MSNRTELQREADKKYRLNNLEKCKAKDRKRYLKNKESEIARNAKYHRENREKVNERTRNRRHRITQEQFDSKMVEQDNRCAICREPFKKTPHIDHDHNCCELLRSCDKCRRGFLCEDCNLGLGRFNDTVELLAAAIQYLNRYKVAQ